MQIQECFIILPFEKAEQRKNYCFLIIFHYYFLEMSNKSTGPQVKHCPRIALPTPPKVDNEEIIPCNPPPSIIVKTVPSAHSPVVHNPIQDIPSSNACLKPEFVSLLEPPAKKKKD